jgi:hypothetical protein
LADRQETQDGCVPADTDECVPIKPLFGIPEAEKNKYKNAPDEYS